MKYSKILNPFKTRQNQAIPYPGQVPNSARGFSWEVDKWTLLDRFLILGSENGTYYIGSTALTVQHARNVIEAIKEDGERVVRHASEISMTGRAPKNDSAIYVLALAASFGDDKCRTAAFLALPQICRTGTHLFAFTEACKGLRGWGRGMRKAVGRWYNSQSAEGLAYQMVKYQKRNSWSNRDLLRLSHPKPASEAHKALYKWAVSGELSGEGMETSLPELELLRVVLAIRESKDVEEVANLIRAHRVPREAVPTEYLNEAEIWIALLENMPLTAMVRNLGNLSKAGILSPLSQSTKKVVSELGNTERLRKARLHPLTILTALVTYSSGRSVRGDGQWKPAQAVINALDRAFYASFANAESTGKRLVLGLDVSGSMEGTMVNGSAGLDCRRACGAMAVVSSAVEKNAKFLAFDTKVHALKIGERDDLNKVVELLRRTGGGGTDCAAPIRYAIEHKIEADAFILYTDSETWAGSQHPAQAIVEYRSKMGINAKLVVVAMASNKFSIADPKDAGILNVVGFDATVPAVIADFIRG